MELQYVISLKKTDFKKLTEVQSALHDILNDIERNNNFFFVNREEDVSKISDTRLYTGPEFSFFYTSSFNGAIPGWEMDMKCTADAYMLIHKPFMALNEIEGVNFQRTR